MQKLASAPLMGSNIKSTMAAVHKHYLNIQSVPSPPTPTSITVLRSSCPAERTAGGHTVFTQLNNIRNFVLNRLTGIRQK